MAQPVPSFLAARAAAAKAASAAAKKKEKAAPTSTSAPPPATAKAPARANTAPIAPGNGNAPSLATKGGNRGKAKGKGRAGERGELQSVEAPGAASSFGGVIREHSNRQEVFDAVAARDPLVWDETLSAMLEGARRPGASGVPDRAALYRMVGLPWAQAAGMSSGTAREIGAGIAGALGHAISRLEGHKRHILDTGRTAPTLEGAEIRHSWGDDLVLAEHEDGKAGTKAAPDNAQAGQATDAKATKEG